MDAAAYLSSALVWAATEEALAGIQFGLGAFNQTLSCCMIHKTDPGPGGTPACRPCARVLASFKMCNQESFPIKVTAQFTGNVYRRQISSDTNTWDLLPAYVN